MFLRNCNLKNTSEHLEFVNMYRSYIEELSQFTNRLKAFPLYDEVSFMWNCQSIQKYFVIHEGQIIGFVLIGIEDNKHPESDWYIEEFFIKKEYQNMGLGKAVAKELLETKRGRYCLFILKRNMRASHFWQKVFTDAGYIDVSQNHVDIAPMEDCEFRMYEPVGYQEGIAI
ncbi:MAG: GNAT family N-acetyltransferase [Lachnospiraceae bacterium]|nr:GNAT family N-acetyltransferase [Lachnospiraceae bacterium]